MARIYLLLINYCIWFKCGLNTRYVIDCNSEESQVWV